MWKAAGPELGLVLHQEGGGLDKRTIAQEATGCASGGWDGVELRLIANRELFNGEVRESSIGEEVREPSNAEVRGNFHSEGQGNLPLEASSGEVREASSGEVRAWPAHSSFRNPSEGLLLEVCHTKGVDSRLASREAKTTHTYREPCPSLFLPSRYTRAGCEE